MVAYAYNPSVGRQKQEDPWERAARAYHLSSFQRTVQASQPQPAVSWAVERAYMAMEVCTHDVESVLNF